MYINSYLQFIFSVILINISDLSCIAASSKEEATSWCVSRSLSLGSPDIQLFINPSSSSNSLSTSSPTFINNSTKDRASKSVCRRERKKDVLWTQTKNERAEKINTKLRFHLNIQCRLHRSTKQKLVRSHSPLVELRMMKQRLLHVAVCCCIFSSHKGATLG